jgi:REP element-mobilizing transposase RayT
MILSDFGKIVETEWLKSFDMRHELLLDEYVIMPNHLHAIVVVQNLENEIEAADFAGTDGRIEVWPFVTTEKPTGHPPSSFYRKPKSISSFVAGFKSAVNSKIDDLIEEHQLPIPKYNRYNHFFQPNYHDHIIRNLLSYLRIKNYIRDNPKNWMADALKISKYRHAPQQLL